MGKPKKGDSFQLFNAMREIQNGADVTGYSLACNLRDMESACPKLVTICEPMGYYEISERRPYFGAILTADGQKSLNEHTYGM